MEIWYGLLWFVGIVWYGGGQMTTEFIHEEISITDFHGLSWTNMGVGHNWHGLLVWVTGMDDWHG